VTELYQVWQQPSPLSSCPKPNSKFDSLGFYCATLWVSAVFAVTQCLSVGPSRLCIVSRRLKVLSSFFIGRVD